MFTSILSVQSVRRPVIHMVYGLGRFPRMALQEFCRPADLHRPHRVLANLVSTFFFAGYPLMAQTFIPLTAPAQNWNALASSADGTYLAGVGTYGHLFLSCDSGATWTMAQTECNGLEPARPWQAIASSADGSHLIAAANFNPLFISTDYGRTWATKGPSVVWAGVASSADGTRLVAVDYDVGGIYTSSDSGATWVLTSAPAKRWRCVACSANGMRLVAGTDFGAEYGQLPEIYTSVDAGASWTLTTAPNEPWQTLACSDDGMKIAAGVYGGLIYLSSDAGTNWAAAAVPSMRWSSISSSGHGTKLVAAASDGQLYVSADTGRTWTAAVAPHASWQAVSCSFDGSRAFAAVWNVWNDGVSGIYTAQTLSPVSDGDPIGTNASLTGPALDIKLASGNAVVSWPASATGFRLQQTSSLSSSDWTDVPSAPVQAGDRNQVSLPFAAGNHFFRLVHN